MPTADQPAEEAVEIVVCLGSSCFARGNARHLAMLDEFLHAHGPEPVVRLTGCLCQDECKQGPNVTVGCEKRHNMTPAQLHELLQSLLKSNGGAHGAA